ncbi:cytochrome p450 [Fusarium acutatum]|uniref:Cytochrome p450 n=1 Tax=Fusarium acutatum TaxID=78861 RepID=A0A8H4JNH9_9HYPO|nr:cytochrome p450 [Fusarium acutatum]
MALLKVVQDWADTSPANVYYLIIGLALLTSIVLVAANVGRNEKYKYPNPVPGIPFFGNGLQVPSTAQGPWMTGVAKKTGDMHTMTFGGQRWLFLNTRKAVHDLLDKKAAIYSSRQNLPMASEVISGNKRFLFMPYGPDWRKTRKEMHSILNNTKSNLFEPYQDKESRALLYHYLHNPGRWADANSRYANSIIMSVIYGKRSELGDEDMTNVLDNLEKFTPYVIPGQSLVDIFPWLLKVPIPKSWQVWRWRGDALYESTKGRILTVFDYGSAYKKLLDDLRERQRLRTQKPCFMTEFLDRNTKGEFTEEETYFMAGTLIEAGSDTTRTTLMVMMAAAVLYPDWVERVQKQLDSVCGYNAQRLPTFDDMTNLPLLKGVVKEALRWKPTTAETGVPHALTKDDSFDGYHIPAGTVVTYNSWAISHLDYEDPERFYPERFLDEELEVPFRGHLGFGAGRRVCVGYNVAWNNMLISVSRLLYCFDIEGVPGKPVDASKSFLVESGQPRFEIKIKPRSEAHAQLIQRECANTVEMEG